MLKLNKVYLNNVSPIMATNNILQNGIKPMTITPFY